MADTSPARRFTDGVVLVAVLPLLLLPQLLGGVHPQVMTGFAILELLALAAWIIVSARAQRPITISWLVLPFLLGAILSAVEVLPLPTSLLTLLAPAPTAMRTFVIAGLPDAMRSEVSSVISMDPPETRSALMRLLGATAMFIIVSNAARRRQRARLIWRFIVVAAAVLFFVAIGHAVLEAPAWGMFRRSSGIISAPIVNANHQSKIFAAFSLLCFGRALACRDRREGIATGIVGIVCGIAVALTLSRGGMLAWGAAVVVGAALLWRARRSELETHRENHLALPALAAALAAVVVGVLLIADRAVVDEVSTLKSDTIAVSKLALWQPALGLLDEHFVAGTGNNAFAMAFTARSVPHTMYDAELTFSHVESILVGTLVEHGAVFGGLLVLIGALIGLRLLQQLRTQADIAAVPAVVVLFIGDLVDFALESSAGIALMAAAVGLCAAALPRPTMRLRTAPGIVCVVIASVLVAAHAPSAIRDWRYRLDRQLQDVAVTRRLPLLQHILTVRPFDGYICAALAVDARHRRQPREALAWANRAINLWPTLPDGHLEAARALAALGHIDQAMLEYREAAVGTPSSMGGALNEAFSRTTDAQLRRRALPDSAAALAQLCVMFTSEQRADDAAVCAAELAARNDASAAQKLEPIRQALARNDDHALRTLLPSLAPLATSDAAHALLMARVVARLEGVDVALTKSAQWLSLTTTSTPELLQWRMNEQLKLDRFADSLETLRSLRLVQRTAKDHDELDRQEAALHGRADNQGQRLMVLQRLSARHPDDVDLLAQVGLTELALGREGAALMTWRRVDEQGKSTATTKALANGLGLGGAQATTVR